MDRLRRALRGADRGERPAVPVGEAMHPVALAALGLLVVNDWVLKPRWPGVVTGKLSDIAGLAFAPVVLSSAIGLVLLLVRRPDPYLTRRRLLACIGLTQLVFMAVKMFPEAARALEVPLSLLRPAHIVSDATDLFALPALAVAYWIGRDELRWLSR